MIYDIAVAKSDQRSRILREFGFLWAIKRHWPLETDVLKVVNVRVLEFQGSGFAVMRSDFEDFLKGSDEFDVWLYSQHGTAYVCERVKRVAGQSWAQALKQALAQRELPLAIVTCEFDTRYTIYRPKGVSHALAFAVNALSREERS